VSGLTLDTGALIAFESDEGDLRRLDASVRLVAV
jgi:hypothetical protein